MSIIKAYPLSTSSPTEALVVTGTSGAGKVALDVNVVSSGTAGLVTTTSTATPSVVTSTTGSQVALAANAARKGFFLFNNSTQNASVTFGATSSTTAFTFILFPNGAYRDDEPFWLGVVSVIWGTANGNMQVTELT